MRKLIRSLDRSKQYWNKEREKEICSYVDRCCCIYVTTTSAQSVWCNFSARIETKKGEKEKRQMRQLFLVFRGAYSAHLDPWRT
jgi:hypothetical protein